MSGKTDKNGLTARDREIIGAVAGAITGSSPVKRRSTMGAKKVALIEPYGDTGKVRLRILTEDGLFVSSTVHDTVEMAQRVLAKKRGIGRVEVTA